MLPRAHLFSSLGCRSTLGSTLSQVRQVAGSSSSTSFFFRYSSLLGTPALDYTITLRVQTWVSSGCGCLWRPPKSHREVTRWQSVLGRSDALGCIPPPPPPLFLPIGNGPKYIAERRRARCSSTGGGRAGRTGRARACQREAPGQTHWYPPAVMPQVTCNNSVYSQQKINRSVF